MKKTLTPDLRLKSRLATLLLFLVPLGSNCQSPTPPLRDVFRRVRPAVVVVATRQRELAPEGPGYLSMRGLGSGVVISEKGDILTAAHVVQSAEEIVVIFSDSVLVPAHVVASSLPSDVALLRLERVPAGLVAAKLADSNRVEVGDAVFVVGHPFGLDYTLTTGVLSARRKGKKILGKMNQGEVFQTDAAVNQGNSGGPMFSMKGDVIGIVSALLTSTGGFEGMGFATPSNVVRQVLLDQKAFWTGVDGYYVDGEIAGALNLPQPAGFLVERIAGGSPGAGLGLRTGSVRVTIGGEPVVLGGDIILEVQGIAVAEGSLDTIAAALARLSEGDPLRLKVLREGQVLQLSSRVSGRK
jgi:serine protease Do